jgi:hypothetical protein
MRRTLYIWLLHLHPASFKHRFGDEMLDIFDECAAEGPVGRLFVDGLVSLLRQWVLRPEVKRPVAAAGDVPLFRTFDDYRPSNSVLFNGGMITLSLMFFLGFASSRGSSRAKYLIGAFQPRPTVLSVNRASYAETNLDTQVKFGPEYADPLLLIAKVYFKIIRVLDALDVNHDFTISSGEIAHAPLALRKLDHNRDGKLSPEECGFSLGGAADDGATLDHRARFMSANPVLAALDTDQNREISAIEIATSGAALLTLDKNSGGGLTPNEVIPILVKKQATQALQRVP